MNINYLPFILSPDCSCPKAALNIFLVVLSRPVTRSTTPKNHFWIDLRGTSMKVQTSAHTSTFTSSRVLISIA